MNRPSIDRFKVVNLGPIAEADVEFGDLTVLTGPQATGKTLFLETLKLFSDTYLFVLECVDNNIPIEEGFEFFFGHSIFTKQGTEFFFYHNNIDITNEIVKSYNKKQYIEISQQKAILVRPDNLFYIPAQRSLALAEGRIKTSDDFVTSPYVLRRFSFYLQQYVRRVPNKMLKNVVSTFDFFNNAEISLKRIAGSMRLEMTINKKTIPYMGWSTGQRELAPMLMSLEYFFSLKDKPPFIVIEEPEMGLHPRAIIEFMLTVLKIMQTGTKVIISTHSSTPLDFVWTIKQLKDKGAKPSELAKMFDFKIKDKTIFDNLFEKSFKTYYFTPDKKTKKVYTKDISSLDVYSEDEDIANWGGMSLSADRAGSIVSRL